MGKLSNITIPTVIISTDDDQITGPVVPIEEIMNNDRYISFVSINRGNHLGTVLEDGRDLVGLIALKFIEATE